MPDSWSPRFATAKQPTIPECAGQASTEGASGGIPDSDAPSTMWLSEEVPASVRHRLERFRGSHRAQVTLGQVPSECDSDYPDLLDLLSGGNDQGRADQGCRVRYALILESS